MRFKKVFRYSVIRTHYYSLVKRKEKWAEQKKEDEKRKPDPDCPKGHKRVPEEERRKVLEKLKKCKCTIEPLDLFNVAPLFRA